MTNKTDTPSGPAALLLNAEDNVAVACRALDAGETLDIGGLQITTQQPIGAGHKLAPVSYTHLTLPTIYSV